MKQIKFLFLLSSLLLTQAIAANPFSYMNPLAWVRGLQRVYYRNHLEAQDKKLADLYSKRIELENFKKMYAAVSAPLPIERVASSSKEDIDDRNGLVTAGNQLNLAFYERYGNDTYYYHISRIKDYVDEQFSPELKKAAQDSYTAVQDLPKSWYEQLKAKEAKLPIKEKQKTPAQRQKEFKEWQANTKFETVKKQKEFFANWHFLRVNSLRPRSLSCPDLLENSLAPHNTIVVTNMCIPKAISKE